MYDTKKTTTEYKRWHREEDGTMVPDVTDYVKLQAWIDTLDPRIKQEYTNIQEEKMMDYNKKAVDKAIKQDNTIKAKEAKLIHALLKGWR